MNSNFEVLDRKTLKEIFSLKNSKNKKIIIAKGRYNPKILEDVESAANKQK